MQLARPPRDYVGSRRRHVPYLGKLWITRLALVVSTQARGYAHALHAGTASWSYVGTIYVYILVTISTYTLSKPPICTQLKVIGGGLGSKQSDSFPILPSVTVIPVSDFVLQIISLPGEIWRTHVARAFPYQITGFPTDISSASMHPCQVIFLPRL